MQFSSVGSLLVPLGRQQRGTATPILPRPTGYAMGMAIRTMNIEENLALTLARGCGRSLTALARLRPSGALQQPTWLAKGQDLLPAILAGAWDTSNSLDRAIVEQIGGGAPWGEIEKRFRGFQRDDDPPFDLEGTVWKVRAPMDAFVRIGPPIGLGDAELLRAAMVTVFSTIEAEADPNDIFLRPNPTGYSDWLREGLATTLLRLAVWSEPAEVNLGGETGQAFANRVLNELPGLRTDARLWTSLRNELPLLAEAAPDPLLSALERMLEGDGSLIRPIFEEHHLPGWPFPETRHIGVLRALETLAWDPEHFRRAVLVLAGLAAIDPGRRQGNRPVQSLGEIFLLWNPKHQRLVRPTLKRSRRDCRKISRSRLDANHYAARSAWRFEPNRKTQITRSRRRGSATGDQQRALGKPSRCLPKSNHFSRSQSRTMDQSHLPASPICARRTSASRRRLA